jgi:ABC transporter substrate binding protein (PQQ-dependent alcohol dehydrogenase system)
MIASKPCHGVLIAAVLASSLFGARVLAQQAPASSASPPPAAEAATIRIGYLRKPIPQHTSSSFVDAPPADEGIAGARLAIADNNTTGRFTGQNFVLDEANAAPDADITEAFRRLVSEGHHLIAVDLPRPALLALADLPEAKPVTLFNVSARDDELRQEQCRGNVLHVIPSRAMLADALVQYLVLKRWRNVLLVPGPTDADKAYAAAVERAIKKFGARLVESKPWTFEPGARRTDSGHFQIASEVASFTQGVSYDVLVVADEEDNFGSDMPFRTTDPRPVAGTQGLTPVAWARPFEQWGATQLQNRFRRQTQRWMTERDYAAWIAVRAVGEAATRSRSADQDQIAQFIHGNQFKVAAFKGVELSFRPWDGQLRQPILLADADSLVSVSPQPGFLHQFSELDTLGMDQPESRCALAK